MRLEDVYPTGEYRAPKKGELYVAQFGVQEIMESTYDCSKGLKRIIVKKRGPVFGNVVEDLEQTIAREESQEIEDDAREAALLSLTKQVLDETIPRRDRRLAAKLILEQG